MSLSSSSSRADVDIPTDISPPVLLSRSATAISLRLPRIDNVKLYRLEISEYGYIYYTWRTVETTARSYTIKDLLPNTSYVTRVSVAVSGNGGKDLVWSTPSAVSPYMRTFTVDESAKRESTYYEHALKIERDERTKIQQQLENLKNMTENHKEQQKTDMHQLLGALEKSVVREQMPQEKYIPEAVAGKTIKELEDKVKSLESLLQTKDEATTKLLRTKEHELEEMMQECRKAVEEASERAMARQAQMETALGEAIRDAQQQLQQKNEILEIMQSENRELADRADALARELCDADAAAAQTNQNLEDELQGLHTDKRKLEDEVHQLRTALLQHTHPNSV